MGEGLFRRHEIGQGCIREWRECLQAGHPVVQDALQERYRHQGDRRKAGVIWNTSTPHLNAEGS